MEKKKIAVLTFHRALNYGAKLQAYALLTTVNKFGDGYILDYRCEQIENFFYRTIGLRAKVKNIIKWLVFPRHMRDLKERKKRFIEFDCSYKFSGIFTSDTVANADTQFDIFFVGSDQIWNPVLTGNDINFFLPFCDKTKRNTYAASLGKAKLTDFNLKNMKQLLADFNTITVREKSMVRHIKEIAPTLNPVPVCDPVFLLKSEEWKKRFNLVEKKDREKYIFVYIVAPQTYAVDKAKKIGESNGWRIKYIDMGRVKQKGIDGVNNAGPKEFLDLLFNAELVITTSFHALALSIILHKPVQFELSKEKVNANSRLVDLVSSVNMEKYEITDIDNIIYDDYKWIEIDNNIKNMREAATNLLENIIEEYR